MARQIQSIIDLEAGTLTVKTEGKDDLVVYANNLQDNIKLHSILHGVKQKVVDAAALPAGATLTEKYLAMQEVFLRITSMEPLEATWNKIGEGGGQPTGLLFKALCRLYPDKAPEKLRVFLDKLDKSQQAGLRKKPKIAMIIEEIKSESIKTSGIDTSSLLDELDNI